MSERFATNNRASTGDRPVRVLNKTKEVFAGDGRGAQIFVFNMNVDSTAGFVVIGAGI